ncbi:MAG: S8 family serine peptidase [Acidimicrobiia bacterium]|nr:S8 family serine peptidase [Acidimicrobiia bacterium]
MTTRRRSWGILLLAVGAALVLAGCQQADLDVTVNSTVDAPAAAAGDGVCEATAGAGDCTLRAAIDEANALEGRALVRLPAGDYPLTLAGDDDTNALGDLDVSGQVTILGPGRVDAAGVDRAFDVTGSLTLAGTAVLGGTVDGDGGAVRVRSGGSLQLVLSTVSGNVASGNGGGVAVDAGGTAMIRAVTLSDNTAGRAGGGLHVAEGANVTVISSTLTSNRAGPDAPTLAGGSSVGTDGPSSPLEAASVDSSVGGHDTPRDADGLTPVIVELRTGELADPRSDQGRRQRERAIDTASARTLDRARAAGAATRVNRTYASVPFVAVSTDERGVAALASDPDVVAVHPDRLDSTLLDQSVPHIRADLAHDGGLRGDGSVVVVIDSGVDGNQPMTAGQVVGGACFARGENGQANGTGDCPNGSHAQIGPDAGTNCPWFDGSSGCWHGTHVATIAAGAPRLINGVPHSGVAPDADILSINVFSRFTTDTVCGQGQAPCIRSWTSDQVAALDLVVSMSGSMPPATVNMSIGGGASASHCDTDPRATPITALRQAGVLTVIASGNSGNKGGIAAPACISSSLAVGATLATTDSVASFSQSAPPLDLLAPGVGITAEFPSHPSNPDADFFITASGTSMAAPHVAGAVALAIAEGAAPEVVADALAATGIPVTDTNGLVRPRVDVASTLAASIGAGLGGGVANDGTLALHAVTITANRAWGGGGLAATTGATTTVEASIIGAQLAGGDCTGPVASAGFNLASDTTCWAGGSDLAGVDPLLEPLADNGGPTLTHRPANASPARDAVAIGVAPLCTGTGIYSNDQRGIIRPQGAGCDLGAVDR